ncbi:MAG: DNA-binding protein WhiA [Lachnospiraceae bacterium]|nr:DNA-binding protein WhiA [Ruminococcus sp.]MCM1274308.1 DNA-binding protein WhiA [Lachnospiraceae bacterium]
MSFSSDIKRELCAVRELQATEAAAMLYGMFFAGRLVNGKPVIQTENADLIAAARALAEAVFPNERVEVTRLVKSGGSLYTFSVKSRRVSERFGDLSSVNTAVVSGNDADGGAFLRGVFVSCGSVTDPKKEYHLEMTLPEKERIEPLKRFIAEHGMEIKSTVRNKNEILYAKTSEVIEDFLTYIGAGIHALEIMQVKIEKDIRNRANRSVNCDSANLDKTVAASEKSRRDIELIIGSGALDGLSAELRETALLRLDNPESSLSELCAMLSEGRDKPISRSGLNHRLKKLSQIAEELRSER